VFRAFVGLLRVLRLNFRNNRNFDERAVHLNVQRVAN